jgi:hypothetical protein
VTRARRTVLALSSEPEGPVVRHRALLWRDALAQAGIALEVCPWPKDWIGRRAALARAEEAGHAWVLSRLLRRADVTRLRARVRRLVFDFDDALPWRDSSRGADLSPTRLERFKAVAGAADLVIAGNEHLAQVASRMGVRARVIPTCVETPVGHAEPEPDLPPFVLGWIGSRATLPYLERVTVPLAAVVAMGSPFRLRVVADAFPTMPPGIPVEEVRWTAEGEGPALDGIHVGLAPLPDDAWTRGKCGLKVLQCMARGRPVVASAIGVQARQVQHGVTGMLARDDAAFVDGVLALLTDHALRRRMGAAAREEVRARWSEAAWRDRVVATLAEALA